MKTTLHNHKQLGTDEKPLIPNSEFRHLCDEIKKRNYESCKIIIERYTLTNFQKNLIKQLEP